MTATGQRAGYADAMTRPAASDPNPDPAPAPGQLTDLLERWKRGDRSVENALADSVYPTLHEMARSHVRRCDGRLTLRATELANEAYVRLHQQREVDWKNRHHFYAIAATVIRRLVIDYLRQRSAEKRGGHRVDLAIGDLAPNELPCSSDGSGWLALDQALTELARANPASASIVEMRVFAGLGVAEIAGVRNCSVATVGRQWRFARLWLADRL